MTYNNFSISNSKGKLYLKEKQPTEGYEAVKYGVNGENTTYHKYFNSIKGIPTYFEQKEVQHDGRILKFLELTLLDGDLSNKVSVPLKNKGGYTDEVKLLISALNGLDMGEEVTLSVSKGKYINKKGEEKEQLNLYINYVNRLGDNGKGLSSGYIQYSDVPPPTSKVVAGDTTWDWSEQTEFYYSKLQEIQAKFQNKTKSEPVNVPTASKTAIPTATAQQAFEPADSVKKENYDDLPFA